MPKKNPNLGGHRGPISTTYRITLPNTMADKINYVGARAGFDHMTAWFLHIFHTAKAPLGYDKYMEDYEAAAEDNASELVHIPIAGTIAAGKPIEPIEENTETVAVPKNVLTQPGEFFALRVRGDSMKEDRIDDGDIVICHHQEDAEPGERTVAMIDEKFGKYATLKRYYPEGKNVRLQPANGHHDPLVIPASKLKIGGKVILIIKAA